MVSQHQNLCIYSSKDPKKVPESTNKLGAQEALRPYLGAKEAKAHRVLSQISLPTESILYKEGERCRCPVRISSQWTTTRTSPIKREGATPLNMTVLTLEHKTCDILAAERLRLMRFDNRLIIDSFQEAVCLGLLKW